MIYVVAIWLGCSVLAYLIVRSQERAVWRWTVGRRRLAAMMCLLLGPLMFAPSLVTAIRWAAVKLAESDHRNARW